MAPIDDVVARRIAWLEAAFLFISAPFLLFPDVAPVGAAIALILLLLGWLVCWRLVGFPLRTTPSNLAFLLFALGLMVGMLVTADPDLTMPKATGMILALASWRFLVFHVRSERALWLAFGMVTAVGLGMIGLGVLSADWRFEVPFVEAIFRLLPPQLVSLPGASEGVHTNQLSGTLTFFAALPVAFLLDRRAFRRRGAVLALAVVGLAGMGGLLLLTQSRSAWMGVVAGVAFLLFSWAYLTLRRPSHRRWLWFLLIVAIVAGIALIVMMWPTLVAALYEDPPDSTPIGTLQTLSFRYEVWRWAIPAIGDFAFTGTGLGTFRVVAGRLYPIYYTTDIAHAHNVFLQVALDVGLPGLAAYLAILGLATLTTFQVARVHQQGRPLALGLLAGLFSFHVYGLTDTLALGSKPGIALWLAIGLIAASWTVLKQGATDE